MKHNELKHKMKERIIISASAGVLAVSLVVTGVTCTVYAAKNDGTESKIGGTDSTSGNEEVDELFNSSLTLSEKEIGKDESVYVITTADGEVEQTIVAEHLYNEDEEATLADASTLSDIENIKGTETYNQNGDQITWNANGNDIYYQGTTTDEIPVTQNVTYYLNGQKVTADELAGATGTVTIRFDYTNNTSYTEIINGKEYTVCVPFAAITALVLDDSATNVVVTNGKVENTNFGNVVVGYALPGMTESLDLDEDKLEDLEIPEYFEVTADVENFSMNLCMTLVANAGSTVSGEGLSLDDLDSVIDELSNASLQLQDGSAELAEGMDTLLTGLSSYLDGASQINAGLNTLANSTGALATGATDLNNGAQELNTAIQALCAGLKSMSAQLSSSYNTYATAAAQAAGVDTFDPTADMTSSAAGQAALTQYQTALNNYTQASMGYSAAVQAALDNINVNYGATLGTTLSLSNMAMDSATYKFVFKTETATALGSYATTFQSGIDAATAAYYQNYVASLQAVSAATTTLCTYYGSAGAASAIYAVSSQMETAGLNAAALDQLAAGSQSLANGTQSLVNAIPNLTTGINMLVNGSNELVSNNAALLDGAQQLSDGANTLAEGMVTFNEEGINKIVDAYNGDVTELMNRLNVIFDAAEAYNGFSGAAENVNVNTRFIIKMDGISED